MIFGTLLLLSMGRVAPAGQTAPPQESTLKIKVHYTGTGTVDDKHRIFIFLFDSTDFMEGDGQPVATGTTTSSEQTVTFSEVSKSPVYAAVVYDPDGNYDGQSKPPAGCSTALYQKTPNVPEPIPLEPGKTIEISLTFDDTHKMR